MFLNKSFPIPSTWKILYTKMSTYRIATIIDIELSCSMKSEVILDLILKFIHTFMISGDQFKV